MEIIRTDLEGVLRIRPHVFEDERGRFHETFNERAFHDAVGTEVTFVQDNESRSHQNVLRGLHFQASPHEQGKLVRVVHGAALDVVLDIRANSPTHGQHFKLRLDDIHKEVLWVPPGLAHGFLALEDDTVFVYKCTTYYAPNAERTILWNDADLAIDWGIKEPVVSVKDQGGHRFRDGWDSNTDRAF